MQSFIRHIRDSNEHILVLARIHWIYTFTGFLWFAVFVLAGMWLDQLLWNYFGSSIPFSAQDILGLRLGPKTPIMTIMLGATGAMIFLIHWVKVLGTEVGVTDQRIIYKSGLIFVEVEELDIIEIRAEHIEHGFFGRFLGYGHLRLDSRFVGDVYLPAMKRPHRIVKAIHTVRKKIRDPLAE